MQKSQLCCINICFFGRLFGPSVSTSSSLMVFTHLSRHSVLSVWKKSPGVWKALVLRLSRIEAQSSHWGSTHHTGNIEPSSLAAWTVVEKRGFMLWPWLNKGQRVGSDATFFTVKVVEKNIEKIAVPHWKRCLSICRPVDPEDYAFFTFTPHPHTHCCPIFASPDPLALISMIWWSGCRGLGAF